MNDDHAAAWAHHDAQLQEAWAAHEFAKVAALAARMGNHPENAPALERTLCLAAGLPGPEPERNDKQPDLFRAAYNGVKDSPGATP